ncbi:MAG: medium chain dehydrogenase/reductase family protein [Bacteroidota bacterium]
MKYKHVVLTKRGGPEVLQVHEATLRPPGQQELQIKVLACGVGRTDIAMRYGYYPFAPKIPFTPGYEIVGEVKEVGTVVSRFKVGDRVAALTVYGGYAEYIYLSEEDLVAVPDGVQADEAVALILNYCTAYQMLHRVLKVKKGTTVLITGASGGVGSALLDLGRLARLKIYGTASPSKHELLKAQEATPVDYTSMDWIDQLKAMQPDGFDHVIDGIGGKHINQGFDLLRKGGSLVAYGYPSFTGMLVDNVKVRLLSLLPHGKKGSFYGISVTYKKDKQSIHEDLSQLFTLLSEQQIKPIISKHFPILEAARANAWLESGKVVGKVVLVGE